jgi:tRNA pseudouridine38-40 synthase
MARYQVVLAYDGTQFAGFQRLNSFEKTPLERTVQGEIEAALNQLGWNGKSILAAGRTDAGVHASGQVIAFNLEWAHSPQELGQALNAHLPKDVATHSVKIVSDDFHPRYDARSRRYSYQVYFQKDRNPLCEHLAWRVWPPADPDLLREAAGLLVGTHDFKAMGKALHEGGSTVRTVWQASWKQWPLDHCREIDADAGLRFEIIADAFLYHMVRRLVFVQIQIGQGKLELDELVQALQTGSLRLTGLAPAQGLVLVKVSYNE